MPSDLAVPNHLSVRNPSVRTLGMPYRAQGTLLGFATHVLHGSCLDCKTLFRSGMIPPSTKCQRFAYTSFDLRGVRTWHGSLQEVRPWQDGVQATSESVAVTQKDVFARLDLNQVRNALCEWGVSTI